VFEGGWTVSEYVLVHNGLLKTEIEKKFVAVPERTSSLAYERIVYKGPRTAYLWDYYYIQG
jgi:hypothetical protein